jgi:hypothetical protein
MSFTSVPRFVDTNVLLSTQVLGEFYVEATRSSRPTPLRH